MKITDALKSISDRVNALEDSDLDDAATVSKIIKVYGDIKITATITASVHTFKVCSSNLYCSENLIM